MPCYRWLALVPRGQLLSLCGESNQRRAKEGGDTLSGCFPSLFGISLLFRWIAGRLRALPVGLLQGWSLVCSRDVSVLGLSMPAPRELVKRNIALSNRRLRRLRPRTFQRALPAAAGIGETQHCIKQPSLAPVATATIPPRVARRALRGVARRRRGSIKYEV